MMGVPRPQPPRQEPADHDYVPTIANRCATCGQPNWPVHDKRIIPDANGCLYNHESLVTGLIKTSDGLMWRRCPGCELLVEQYYQHPCLGCRVEGQPHIEGHGAVGNRYEKGRGSLTARQQDRLKAWLGWWKWNGGDG